VDKSVSGYRVEPGAGDRADFTQDRARPGRRLTRRAPAQKGYEYRDIEGGRRKPLEM
jgi:hypothetical protein